MTDRPAVFEGDLHAVRTVVSRDVAQLVIEIPLAEFERFVATIGGPAGPGTQKRVVIARLASDAVRGGLTTLARERAERQMEPLEQPERRRFSDMAYAAQAAMRCNEPEFWKFLAVKVGSGCNDAERAAHIVRAICKVESRRELDSDAAAGQRWAGLDAEFYGWQRDPRAG